MSVITSTQRQRNSNQGDSIHGVESRKLPSRRDFFKSTAALAAVAGAAACGRGETGRSGEYRIVDHAMGRTRVGTAPRRIVTLDDGFTSSVLALHRPIIGYTTPDANHQQLPAYLGSDGRKFGGQAQWVGSLSEPDMERIALLRPDLILSAKVRHQQLYDQLSAIAPTVFSVDTGASWRKNLLLTGAALGQHQQAAEWLEDYRKRAEAVGDAIRTAVGHNPTISLIRFAGEPTVRLYTPNSFPGIVLDDTGLARPEGQPMSSDIAVRLSPERIPELDAEHLFVSTYRDSSGEADRTQAAFRANPLWTKLRGKQHPVSDTTWMTAVGPHGAHRILDDLCVVFRIDPARTPPPTPPTPAPPR